MAGNQTIKRIFEVPAFNAADGTLRIWPCFHRSPVFTAGGYEWSISYYPKSIYDRDSIDLCLQLESEGPGGDDIRKPCSVRGELFHAHKVVLSTRSLVFEAELFGGPTSTAEASQAPAAAIEVDDMRPDVFKTLLHYIYTDTLPATEGEADDDEEARSQMTRHLLVAADRYGLEGLKLLYEGELAKTLGEGNMAEMLAFTDDQYCSTLKDACVGFMVASPERMERVVASYGYQQLCL
ncbi:BTB/POZ and MATH domain-containing protein 1-like [Panicum virgatum]|uniref:BTB/POZ and MATH domain-containing protein 1-like n=1 Tax=Panicum virgatum TaxID=38727 RepID=UPI0019D5BEB2|nr:BTB/POZ and MATH domain-containing protein 1-like [Panicum virgatum]